MVPGSGTASARLHTTSTVIATKTHCHNKEPRPKTELLKALTGVRQAGCQAHSKLELALLIDFRRRLERNENTPFRLAPMALTVTDPKHTQL